MALLFLPDESAFFDLKNDVIMMMILSLMQLAVIGSAYS